MLLCQRCPHNLSDDMLQVSTARQSGSFAQQYGLGLCLMDRD